MFKKAITHLHTYYSYDSLTSPKKIVEKAVKLKIDYIAITDHESLAGSIEAAAYASEKGYGIQIPISAEFATDVGDIVVVGVHSDFKRHKNHEELCRQAKKQGGFTILPHPFKGHHLDKINFDLIDCVEVFNSRCSVKENLEAIELANSKGKPKVYGSDAHMLADVDNAVYAYSGDSPFDGQTNPLRLVSTPKLHMEYSRLIRGVKLQKPKEVLRAIKNSLRHLLVQNTSRHEL